MAFDPPNLFQLIYFVIFNQICLSTEPHNAKFSSITNSFQGSIWEKKPGFVFAFAQPAQQNAGRELWERSYIDKQEIGLLGVCLYMHSNFLTFPGLQSYEMCMLQKIGFMLE